VDGEVTPDSILVDSTRKAIRYRVGAKQFTYTTVEKSATSADLSRRPCLTKEQVVELATTCKSIERAFGRPMDIEWTLRQSEFVIVQARPLVNPKGPTVRPSSVQTDPTPL
jgi:rifampicin phosphotransferase